MELARSGRGCVSRQVGKDAFRAVPQPVGLYLSFEVVYQTANNGYPVILCNVGNFYMDMAYNGHPDERGLDWGGYVDESVSFSMLPFSIYRSLRVDMAGNPIDLNNAEKGKTALTEIGKKHIMGVQGQLFAETIRSFDGVEYLLFPKILGLAERGWNAHPAWENLSGIREEQASIRLWHFIMRKSARVKCLIGQRMGLTSACLSRDYW